MWLPIYDHTFPLPIPTTWTSVQIATRATGPIANGVILPKTVMLTGAADGLNPRPLADLENNLLNLIPAQSQFWNALAHWPLSLSWQSIMKVEVPRTVKSGPNLLHPHIRSLNMSVLPRTISHSKLGISCVHKCMNRHPKRNQKTACGSLWRTLIVWVSLRKAQRSIIWINLAGNSTPIFWQDAKPKRIGAKPPTNNNFGIS